MSQNGENLMPADQDKQSPGGYLRVRDPAELLECPQIASNLKVWKPKTPKKTPSTSAPRPLKKALARRSLVKRAYLQDFITDSGSDITSDSNESDTEGVYDFRAEREYARLMREREILNEEARNLDRMSKDVKEEVMPEEPMDVEVIAEVMNVNDECEQPSAEAYDGIITIDADDQVVRVLAEERMIHNGNDDNSEQPTLAQEYADKDVFTWTDDFTSFSGQAEKYLRTPASKLGSQEPGEIFQAIWSDDIMKTIVKETNEYAWRHIAPLTEHPNNLPSYLSSWTELTVAELYQYFALLILMSLCLRTKINEYWSTDLMEMCKFRQLMCRDRFKLITKFLHFVDNDQLDPRLSSYDKKIFKIRPILDHCNKKFAALYVPNKHLSLDESLLLWKGRLSWKQYIRTKAARFGIKSYELCEAVTGYQLRCLIYAGKDSAMSKDPIHGFENSTAKVVLELMDGLLNAGHTLVMDNWYNQLPLTRFLKKHKTDVIGTLNRRQLHVPHDIKITQEAKLHRGEQIARHCGDISLVSWKDLKLVTVMSTCHGDEQLPARRAGMDIQKPAAVLEYNKFMGGVDSKDQKLSMFLMERKRGKKWYMKVFKRQLNTSILNAFIIYRKNPVTKELSHRDFRLALAKSLLQKFHTKPQPLNSAPAPSSGLSKRLMAGQHFVEITSTITTNGKSRRKQMRCTRCNAAGRRSMVTLMCSFCRVPLCHGPCWAEYHTLPKL